MGGWDATGCQVNDLQKRSLKRFDAPGSFGRCQSSREPGLQPTRHIRHFQNFTLQRCRIGAGFSGGNMERPGLKKLL